MTIGRRYIKEIAFKSQKDKVHIVLDNGDILDACTDLRFGSVSGNPNQLAKAHLKMLVGMGDE